MLFTIAIPASLLSLIVPFSNAVTLTKTPSASPIASAIATSLPTPVGKSLHSRFAIGFVQLDTSDGIAVHDTDSSWGSSEAGQWNFYFDGGAYTEEVFDMTIAPTASGSPATSLLVSF